MADRRRVVVTGLGVATPIGIGIDAYWDALLSGGCGIRRIDAFDPSGFPSQIGGMLPEFSLSDFIPKSYRKSAKIMARDIQIAVVCAYHAVVHAGLVTKCLIDRGESPGPANIASPRFGANIGAGLICADLPELAGALSTAADEDNQFDISRWGREGMTNLTPLWLLKFLPNMLACHVTIIHDCQGASNTITCGEASSHLAIGEAFRQIARGTADVCICGGAESKINQMALARSTLQGRLNAESNDAPTDAVRPFCPAAKGSVVSEGGGLVILESLEHAEARGATILAELTGFGASTNTKSWHRPDSEGMPTALAVSNALRDAALSSRQVGLLATGGTGISRFDQSELAGLTKVFGADLPRIPAVATRGAIGSNGAGSGAIDFTTAVMALYTNTIPPSRNAETGADAAGLHFTQNGPVDAQIDSAVSLSYALAGGQHSALVVRKFKE